MKIYNRTGIFNGLNKKIIGLVVAVLLLMPLLSNAAINLINPGNTFTDVDFLDVVTNVATLIISFIAILGIIFLVYGGLQYVTSAGDESKSEDAKRTITYAMIGLFLAASAYAIEKLILVTLVAP
ncbi:MAG: hypothetical protein V1732_04570 [Patescibacteria group bacterium]